MILDGNSLSLPSFKKVVFENEPVELSEAVKKRVTTARNAVEKRAASGEKVYSINTGFGILSQVTVPPNKLAELQLNFVRSHCAGVGPIHSEVESRAMILLRANTIAKGYCGVRVEILELLVGMLNQRVHPVVPTLGSVGSSGDLAPLAHIASVLIGEGEAFYQGKRLSGKEALAKAGLSPVVLQAKEGLSLTNGTQQMTAMAALLCLQAQQVFELADLICSATLEGISGSPKPFSSWIHETRSHEGQKQSAANLRHFMEDSEIVQSHESCDRVQDPYSLRCAPQVHGACRDLFRFVEQTVTTEMNSATDNPLVNYQTDEILSNGNFHGQPIAFALDIGAMALAELGNISERRTVKLLNPVFSGLPTFLVKDEGLHSGYMIPQYTAASLVVENRVLCHPASTDSIPTNNDKEDHNSMGPVSARKAHQVLKNLYYILAVEALCAAQAIDFRRPLKPGKGPHFLHQFIRARIPTLDKDRYQHPDMELMAELLRSGELYRAMKKEKLGDS